MKYFGTDGIRGHYPSKLTNDLITKAVSGLALVLKPQSNVVLSRDPRLSSEPIFEIVINTLQKVGLNVIDLGILPTPFVSFVIRKFHYDAGIMISASHNPFDDNGIKFFNHQGMKLNDEDCLLIEQYIDNPYPITANQLGNITYYNPLDDYLALFKDLKIDLTGLKIAFDCANGASYQAAPYILSQLGCEVIFENIKPDGYNINQECGALYPQNLKDVVIKNNCIAGFCLDGDGDRIICLDHLGHILTGDHLIYLLAMYLFSYQQLNDNCVVVTSMSNLGLLTTLKQAGITPIITDVGDRFVIQAMESHNYNLGGEQSGHIILSDYIPSGDGLLVAIFILNILRHDHLLLAKVVANLPIYPQKLVNIKVKDQQQIMHNEALLALIKKVNDTLASQGRVLIRASGTEPLIRVMVEAQDETQLTTIINYFVDYIENMEKNI